MRKPTIKVSFPTRYENVIDLFFASMHWSQWCMVMGMLYKIIGLCNADLQRCTNFVQRTKLMNQTIQADSVVVLAYETNFTRASPVVERLGALSLNRSIISPLCLVRVRAPLWPHVRQAKFCLRVCQVVFLGVLPFSPH